jgi:hypothetical protein
MLKNLFRRKMPAPPLPQPGLTLKMRVRAFWEWYSAAAGRFYAEIENGRCAGLEAEVAAKVDELIPGLGWVFGPGEGGRGHSFTLTPEGDADKRFIAQYWLQQAPALENWTFHASRQPSDLHRRGHHIEMDGMKFAADAVWLVPRVNEAARKADITVWHPLFDRIPERTQQMVTFLWLDEALGEDNTFNWIGIIDAGSDRLTEAIPLSELPEYLEELQTKHGWKKPPPHRSFSLYQMNEPEAGSFRSDIVGGNSCHMGLVNGYPLGANPLEAFGAEYMMVAFPTTVLPRGAEVDRRGTLEDLIAESLQAEASGAVLGGALGIEYTYIDLLLCDGESSRRLVRRALAGTSVAGSFRLLPFVER